jgi:tRNA pseudouridine38-40 synthase
MPTYRIDLAYDGTGFHGYARQEGLRTVQGEFETALFRRIGEVSTAVAGRTDAGVHAAGQVISFSADTPIDIGTLQRSLNSQLGPEIAVYAVSRVSDGFHARFSAIGRRYRYRIWNSPVHDPLQVRTTWHVREPLDAVAMDRAAGSLVGTHDFASFCRKAPGRSTVRELRQASWNRVENLIELSIAANAFCHRMVRTIVATSVEIGRGRLDPDATLEILGKRDQSAGNGSAPPQGLTLMAVEYERVPRVGVVP